MIDEDKRQILVYQERLFEDGDLHLDGKREKKFRWRNADNDVWLDHLHDSDDSDEDDSPQYEDKGVKIIYKICTEPNLATNEDSVTREDFSVMPEVNAIPTSMRAFSGPRNSILSYVVKDRLTHAALSNKAISPKNQLKRPLKKLKTKKASVQRTTKIVSTTGAESKKPSGPNMLELLSRFE